MSNGLVGQPNVAEAQKQQNQKAYYSEACSNEQAEVRQAVGIPLAVHRLQYQRESEQKKSRQRDRVIDILTRHPEFEEFLEVLRSGLV